MYINEIISAASIPPEKKKKLHPIRKKKKTRFCLISVAFWAKNDENIQEVKILLSVKGLRIWLYGGKKEKRKKKSLR